MSVKQTIKAIKSLPTKPDHICCQAPDDDNDDGTPKQPILQKESLRALAASHERLEQALRQIYESFNTRDRYPADHMLRVLGIAQAALKDIE